MPHVVRAQTHVSIWIGSHSMRQWRQNFYGNSKCKLPKSNYIFYFESIVFDKMHDRKFIIFIWLYDVAAYIIDMSETN